MFEKEIDAFIEKHKEEMIDDICELCGINSEKLPYEEGMPFGPGVAECLDVALDIAEGYEFDVQDYDSFVGTVDLGEGPRQLDILAHLDVVPAGEGWTVTKPYQPLIQDGKIYGRGTSDDKGPAIAALYAMRAVKELGIPLKKSVRLILGTDEECGSSDIRHYYDVEKEAPMTFSPDGEYPVVNIEKGRLEAHFDGSFASSSALPRMVSLHAGTKANVVPGKAKASFEGLSQEQIEGVAAGVAQATGVTFEYEIEAPVITVTAIGKGAHASTPEEGVNALTALMALVTKLPLADCAQVETVTKLLALMPHGDTSGKAMGIEMSDEISGALTLAFSMLDVTEDHLDGVFDSRCPICATKESVLMTVNTRIAEIGLAQNMKEMVGPHHVDENSELVKTLLGIYEQYTGLKGECIALGGGTYVHNLKNGVAFGAVMPGTDTHMHGADEFVVIEELVISAKMFAQAIVRLCS